MERQELFEEIMQKRKTRPGPTEYNAKKGGEFGMAASHYTFGLSLKRPIPVTVGPGSYNNYYEDNARFNYRPAFTIAPRKAEDDDLKGSDQLRSDLQKVIAFKNSPPKKIKDKKQAKLQEDVYKTPVKKRSRNAMIR